MTASGNGKGPPYAIIMSQAIRLIVKGLHAEAMGLGRGNDFVRALRQIINWLRMEPSKFGEPLYSLPALSLTVRHGMVGPLVVFYGVHNEKALVFVTGFKVLW